MSNESRLTRREFAASALVATLTAACARVAPGTETPAPAPGGTAAGTQRPDAHAPQAEALTTVVVAQYGRWIEPDERPKVRDGIARGLRLADRLRRAPITNAADPFTVCLGPMEER